MFCFQQSCLDYGMDSWMLCLPSSELCVKRVTHFSPIFNNYRYVCLIFIISGSLLGTSRTMCWISMGRLTLGLTACYYLSYSSF